MSDDENSLYSCENATFLDYLNEDDSKQIYDNGNRIIYKCLIKYIVEAIDNNEILFNENNRMVDNERLKDFIQFESSKCDPIILALRVDKNSTFDIIDGQHRITFLSKCNEFNIDKNKIMNDYLPIDIRICKNENDFKIYINSTNNRKNFSSDQLRVFKYPILRELLLREFRSIFTSSYIKIDEDLFKNKLFKSTFFEDFNNTPDIIFDKIKRINLFFKNIDDKCKLSSTKDMTKKSYIKERDKAEKINFFIGLDTNLLWFILLDLEESCWNDRWNSIFELKRKIKKLKKVI